MVKQISATIKVEVTESDDAKHRYVLYKSGTRTNQRVPS